MTVTPEIDDIRLAIIADTCGRTRRSRATSFAGSQETVPTLYGLTMVRDRTSREPDRMLPLFEKVPPVEALDRFLEDIERRCGGSTADFVALTNTPVRMDQGSLGESGGRADIHAEEEQGALSFRGTRCPCGLWSRTTRWRAAS